MYIVDGTAYAGEPTPIVRVKSIRPLDDYKLWVRFTTDEIKIFDFKPLLDSSVFQPLNDISLFNQVYVDYGVAVWNDGEIDISTEKLYEDGLSIKSEESA